MAIPSPSIAAIFYLHVAIRAPSWSVMGCNFNPTLVFNLIIWARYAEERDGTVAHFQFLDHFGEPNCKMMSNWGLRRCRMSVCKCCNAWSMNMSRKGGGETFQKSPRGPPGLTYPSDGRIAINSTYAFTSLCRDLTQVYLKQKLAIEVLIHHPS